MTHLPSASLCMCSAKLMPLDGTRSAEIREVGIMPNLSHLLLQKYSRRYKADVVPKAPQKNCRDLASGDMSAESTSGRSRYWPQKAMAMTSSFPASIPRRQ